MKTVLTLLAALSFLAGGAPDKTTSPDPTTRLGKPAVVGVIEAVSPDGKTIAVATEEPGKPGPGKPAQVKLTDKTRVIFTSVQAGGAKARKGYFIRAWVSKGVATRVQMAGMIVAGGQAPDFSGLVTDHSADGKSFTVLLAPADGGDKEEKAAVKLTNKTSLTFSHVPAHGARLHKGLQAVVWLAAGSKETAARVRFYGPAEKRTSGGARPAPAYQGKVTRVEDGKRITLAVVAKTKDNTSTPRTILLADDTPQLYSNVPAGGASPKVGYTCVVWPAGDGKDGAVKKVLFINPPRPAQTLLLGKVGAVADGGKRFTLLQPASAAGEEPTPTTIGLTDKARLIFHNVGPGAARPTKGYSARVWLAAGSKDAVTVVFEGQGG
jgi:hypothetical protein